jgi:hypothetical protein
MKSSKKVEEVEMSAVLTTFRSLASTSNTKGTITMRYNIDSSIDDAGHKLVCLKDRSNKSKPGKFSARAKADKPKNRGLAVLEETCKKESIRDVEVAKLRISQARYSRKKAEALGHDSRRGEKRYYLCDRHAVSQFHLTKLGEAEYAKKFEASIGKGYALAS